MTLSDADALEAVSLPCPSKFSPNFGLLPLGILPNLDFLTRPPPAPLGVALVLPLWPSGGGGGRDTQPSGLSRPSSDVNRKKAPPESKRRGMIEVIRGPEIVFSCDGFEIAFRGKLPAESRLVCVTPPNRFRTIAPAKARKFVLGD